MTHLFCDGHWQLLWFLYTFVLFSLVAAYVHWFSFSNSSWVLFRSYMIIIFISEYDVIGLWVQTAVKTSEGSTHNAQCLQTDKNLGPSPHRQEEKDSFQIHSSVMPHLPPKHKFTPLTPTNAQSRYPAHATFVPTSSATWDHLVKHIQIFPCQNHSVMWG